MPIHDAYARLTPYELVFPDPETAEALLREVAEEGERRGVDLGDPSRFVHLESAARALRTLSGPEDDPERSREHGLLLYHAFHFWREGLSVFLLGAPLVRRLVTDEPPAGWEGELPAPAGYVQLPQHLVWTGDVDEGGRESVDGFFWSAPRDHDHLRLLLATGMRKGRAGLSVVVLPPAPLEDAASWPALRGREAGADFASSMPGAELEGLYELTTAAEVFQLVSRTFAWIRNAPRPEPGTSPAEAGASPAPSGLAYVGVRLE